jgi:Ca2+-binding EF-hand superfamily protein
LIFDSYDADGDGGINAEELLSWLVDEGKNDGVNYVGQNNEAKMKVSRGEGAVQQMSRVVMF